MKHGTRFFQLFTILVGLSWKKVAKIYLYKHTNKSNGKAYIGISGVSPPSSWNDGYIYLQNKEFYNDILRYGWNKGFEHEILYDNLSPTEAAAKQCELIVKYDAVEHGYNSSYTTNLSALPEDLRQEVISKRNQDSYSKVAFNKSDFSFYDFTPLKKSHYFPKSDEKYFTRFPNYLIRNNFLKKHNLHRILAALYIEIDRNRTMDDRSYISIGNLLNLCKYPLPKNKPKIFYEIIKSLLFLGDSNLIHCDCDFSNVKYDTFIELTIIPQNFDSTSDFTIIYWKDFRTILNAASSVNRDNLLLTFLYVCSFMGHRPRDADGKELMDKPQDNPEAFFKDIHSMAKDISMSRNTITDCMKCLVDMGLLVKETTGSFQKDDKPPQNAPNIYVLNKDGYKQEIKWAYQKMLDVYGVDKFYSQKGENLT